MIVRDLSIRDEALGEEQIEPIYYRRSDFY
jgi:hypothetical protein